MIERFRRAEPPRLSLPMHRRFNRFGKAGPLVHSGGGAGRETGLLGKKGDRWPRPKARPWLIWINIAPPIACYLFWPAQRGSPAMKTVLSDALQILIAAVFIIGFVWILTVMYRHCRIEERPVRLLRMARRLGLRQTTIDEPQIARYLPVAARLCHYCKRKGRCDAWLATIAEATAPPRFCANAEFLCLAINAERGGARGRKKSLRLAPLESTPRGGPRRANFSSSKTAHFSSNIFMERVGVGGEATRIDVRHSN